MSFPPSFSVSVECVSICKLNAWRSDCSALSCAWKAPRALTGSLASTTHGSSCSYSHRRRVSRVKNRYEASNFGFFSRLEGSYFSSDGGVSMRTSRCSSEIDKWNCCSSCVPESLDEISAESLWEDLKPTISYLSPNELELVQKSLKLAFDAHNGQKRRSGEPFITHPVEVARILGQLESDWETIAAGLLHDTVEDTKLVTFERIEKDFGSTVRRIVEGETKVSKLGKLKYKNESSCVQEVKANDLAQMFLAMTEEVRVIIVKLADRLHNMRTLSHMPPHKQASIALETLEVFAPLAKKLGMYKIKSELENLSFMYTNSQDYEEITMRIAELYDEREKELDEANKILVKKIEGDQLLELMGVRAEVQAVCKEPYSVYKDVIKSNASISELNQIAQVLIIIKPRSCSRVGPLCSAEQICYHVLGLVHGIWNPVPKTMKDYIATPKDNGYQSLHTVVIPFLNESMFRLEVQIRTEEMDLIARRGVVTRNLSGKAACFDYRNTAQRIGWLNSIREWQEEFLGNMSSRDFVDVIKRDLLGSRVFVYTPRGEIKSLPMGATVIDYAYMIHTEIGNTMVAAKINGNCVKPTHVLANAEVVEIITDSALSSKTALQMREQWLLRAKTRSARHKIVKFLKEQAALSNEEITADAVSNSDSDSEKEGQLEELSSNSNVREHIMEKTSRTLSDSRSLEELLSQNGGFCVPKVNGFHQKHEQISNSSNGRPLAQDHDIAKMMVSNTKRREAILTDLESWQTSKIAAWHSREGNSIQWLSIVSIDRRGILGEVTRVLASLGISVCSCMAETDKERGVGVMMFHIEGNLDNVEDACSRIEAIHGIMGWSAGCSLQPSNKPYTFD